MCTSGTTVALHFAASIEQCTSTTYSPYTRANFGDCVRGADCDSKGKILREDIGLMNLHRLVAVGIIVAAALVMGNSAKAQDFKGFYVGGNVGIALGKSNATTTSVDPVGGYFLASDVVAIAAAGAQKLSSSNFTGGGLGGYNAQMGNFVFGVEGEFGRLGL